MGRTIPGIQADSSVPGRDQTGVLPRRREVGEPGCVEVIPWRRRSETTTDVDPDRWGDEEELTELPEISVGDKERVFWEMMPDPGNEITTEPDLDIPMILNDPEEIAVREGIHERIKVEIYHENKEREAQAEEMLDLPPEWNEVKDLIMEEGDILSENMRLEKRMKDEISRGRRKWRKEDNIRAEKREHSPTVFRRM